MFARLGFLLCGQNEGMRTGLVIFSFLIATINPLVAQEHQEKGITVTGKGVVKAKPDRVKIKVRVENEGQSAEAVKTKTDKTTDEVLKFIRGENISEKDYKTEYINLDKRYDPETEETKYSAQQAISIKLKDLDRYESLMKGLMEAGINRIDGIAFKNSEIETYKKEARKKAAKNAKEKAGDYVENLGVEIGKPELIKEMDGNSNQPRPMMMRAEASMADQSEKAQTLAVGQMKVKAKIKVRFSLDLP